jgi:hypothetical protein
MTADDGHAELVGAWEHVRQLLDRMPSLLQWGGDVEYMELREKADRVTGLGSHLESAIILMKAKRYESAFALLRTCLEHMVVDWLVFQGRTLVQHFSSVSEETWAKWQQERADGAEWTRTIKAWSRKKGQVRIVREGLYSEPAEDGSRQQISIYYFLLEQYSPALGPPSQQLDDGLIGADQLRRMAEENRAMWEVYLTWSSLLTNLQQNGLVDQYNAGRLAVHYRFLSGYTHPVADQRRDTYGQNVWQGWPRYDHYSSELILLYALTMGVREVRNFMTSVSSRTDVTIAGLDEVEARLVNAEAASAHFWFLGVSPHDYDVWTARNALAFRAFREERQQIVPPEPAAAEVAYPRDPLKRLVAMHSSTLEYTTGLVYTSPWHREDARFR